MWLMDPTPVEITQMPTDPANFWLGLIAAVGLFALSSFPAWDRLLADAKAGKKTTLRRRSVFATLGMLLPLSLLLTALGSLGMDPVPVPTDWQKGTALAGLAVLVTVRAVFSGIPDAEQTPPPTVVVAPQDSTPQGKRTRVTMRDTVWATLVAGAFFAGRRRR